MDLITYALCKNASSGSSLSFDSTELENKISKLETSISTKANVVPIVETSETTIEIEPDKYYVFGEVSSLNITLASPEDDTILSEYMFEFTSGSTATVLTLPDSIKWFEAGAIEANKKYQVSIIRDIAIIVGVNNE